MFIDHFLNFMLAWFRSRKWLQIGGLGLLVGCVPLTTIILVISGASTPISVMASSYHELIEPDLELDANPQLAQDVKVPNRKLQVPLRRILQMNVANDRVKYYVAYALAQQGRLSMASRLMREVAPSKDSGYPNAHAWLAAYAMGRNSMGEEVDLKELMHDLEIAINQSSVASPSMIVAYAALLDNQNRGDEALALLRSRRQQFPELNVAYAELAERLDEKDDLKTAIREGTEELESRFKSGEGGEGDVVQLVRLSLLAGDFDRAVAISQGAVNKFPESPVYRQVYSSALLAKYASLDENRDIGSRMQYLDAAFKAYPSNDRVVAEVAKVMASGVDMPESLRTEVESLLADGNAPAVAHLILANGKLSGDQPDSAIAHLELALRQMPNSSVVMNNLAVAILQARPKEIARAEDLVEKALQIPGASASMLASMLDTQGQIRLAQEDFLGAIESFEKAIQLDHSKLNTRRLLAETYNTVGMTDLAAVQKRRIDQLSEPQESQPQ